MNRNKFIFFTIALISLAIAAGIMLYNGNEKNKSDPDSVKTSENNNKDNNNKDNKNMITLNIISKTGSSDDFVEEARKEFIAKNPNIQINFKGLGTFEAADYINKDNDVDAWISADETGVDTLRNKYSTEHGGKDIIVDATSIVASPLVLVGWEDRLNKLGEISINSLYDIVSQGKTWQSLGGQSNWGFVNFSHTDPIKSNSGVQFVTLLTHNFYSMNNSAKKTLQVEDIANDKLVEYIKKFEKNTAKQEDGSGKFIELMVLYGPSRYDIGAIYEYYALSNIKNAKGRWGNLKIIYPNPTIWSDKPFIILKGPNSTDEKVEACKKFRDYLLSVQVQQNAMKQGYRPSSPEVTDLSPLEKEFAAYGFKKDIPAAVPPPDIKVIERIQQMVQRIR
ncbi:MAG: extracellular solute-binding protein [Bacillota bacterium]|nr:extracellular solute-binding protein [Bacillota bacterium]